MSTLLQVKHKNIPLILSLIFFNLLTFRQPQASEAEIAGIEKQIKKLSLKDEKEEKQLKEDEEFIQSILNKEYNRDLVTRFINAFPNSKKTFSHYTQNKLADYTGVQASPLSKLKNPDTYGPLDPTARRFWKAVQGLEIQKLKEELSLKPKDVHTIAESLRLIDLSNKNIVYNELAEEYYSKSHSSQFGPRPLKEIIQYLEHIKGTFTKLNLAKNNLSNEGSKVLIEFLSTYNMLEELNLSQNNINDSGFKILVPLLSLPNFRKLNISGNYGPTEETLSFLLESIPTYNKDKIQIITK